MRTLHALLALGSLVVLLGACGSADTTTGADGGGVTVATAERDPGEVLVDGDGMTLYLFDSDPDGESACTDGCAETWPPLLGTPTAGAGVDAGLLGTIERPDGATQATYAGHPLYHYAPDEAPGDVTGQGVGEVWWVVAPDGSAIRGDGPTSTATPTGGATTPAY